MDPVLDEINAVASVLYQLFSNPRLGEGTNEKRKHKPKTILGTN